MIKLRLIQFFFIIAISSMVIAPKPSKALSYPIDCAILLCMAGGFPYDAAGVCLRARQEMILRITPWPIEPPLQLWRCPMSISFHQLPTDLDLYRLRHASFNRTLPIIKIQSAPTVDLSNPDFEFLQSLEVWDIDYHVGQRRTELGDIDCKFHKRRIRRGFYTLQGEFSWEDSDIETASSRPWLGFRVSPIDCRAGRFRGVAMIWADQDGDTDHEVHLY